jgi:hypothetical protein
MTSQKASCTVIAGAKRRGNPVFQRAGKVEIAEFIPNCTGEIASLRSQRHCWDFLRMHQ